MFVFVQGEIEPSLPMALRRSCRLVGDEPLRQVLCGSVFIQRSKLIDGFFRAGLAAGQQVGNGAVTLCVPDLGIALVLAFDEGRVVGLVELPFYIREGRRQIVRVLWVESRTETVKAVPVDVALGSFRVDVLTVGKVETAVIVLGVVSAVCSGSSVVSCQFQIDIPPFQQLGVEKRSSGAAGSAAFLRQIIPSRI